MTIITCHGPKPFFILQFVLSYFCSILCTPPAAGQQSLWRQTNKHRKTCFCCPHSSRSYSRWQCCLQKQLLLVIFLPKMLNEMRRRVVVFLSNRPHSTDEGTRRGGHPCKFPPQERNILISKNIFIGWCAARTCFLSSPNPN